MILDRVTITGADDSIEPEQLAVLSQRFPFAEWGILLSKRQEGTPRFPTLAWMEHLRTVAEACALEGAPLKLSGHLCGHWVRDLCLGSKAFLLERASIARMFQRVQLNFHAEFHSYSVPMMTRVLRKWARDEYIFQADGVNETMFESVRVHAEDLQVAPLFDTSGGAGIEPKNWPAPVPGVYCGYAGGLHPDRIVDQLHGIGAAAGGSRIWIDVETHVRSGNDQLFDLEKVERFLKACTPFVSAR